MDTSTLELLTALAAPAGMALCALLQHFQHRNTIDTQASTAQHAATVAADITMTIVDGIQATQGKFVDHAGQLLADVSKAVQDIKQPAAPDKPLVYGQTVSPITLTPQTLSIHPNWPPIAADQSLGHAT